MENISQKTKLIFLDIDGVLNCELFYEDQHRYDLINPVYWIHTIKWKTKKYIKYIINGFEHRGTRLADYKYKPMTFNQRIKRFKSQVCPKRLKWLDSLCNETGAKIVISSVWKKYFSVSEWNTVFFKLKCDNIECIGVTGSRKTLRGSEILEYLQKNYPALIDNPKSYAILDDDSDMLSSQKRSFFQTDPYSGLTPNICYRIKRHLN